MTESESGAGAAGLRREAVAVDSVVGQVESEPAPRQSAVRRTGEAREEPLVASVDVSAERLAAGKTGDQTTVPRVRQSRLASPGAVASGSAQRLVAVGIEGPVRLAERTVRWGLAAVSRSRALLVVRETWKQIVN
ncbi:MAG: hypothetical protein LBL92_00495 [Propionibacteriaceae bacterium]|nr:hypothetical protein [Propionibacteriaceae bacterium]